MRLRPSRPPNVVAGVNFARERNLRLVVKGGGHSYHGTSNCADSLLIWTRRMNRIQMHETFVAQGCVGAAASAGCLSRCGCCLGARL